MPVPKHISLTMREPVEVSIHTTNPTISQETRVPQGEVSVDEPLLGQWGGVLGPEKEGIWLVNSAIDLFGGEEIAGDSTGVRLDRMSIPPSPSLADLHSCLNSWDRQTIDGTTFERLQIAPLKIRKGASFRGKPGSVEYRHDNSSTSPDGELASKLEELLRNHRLVSSATTTKPRAGLLEEKLVAFVVLTGLESGLETDAASQISLIPEALTIAASAHIASLKKLAQTSLGHEYVPYVWVVVIGLPVLESGEVDRRQLRTWAQNINEDIFQRIMVLNTEQVHTQPETDTERILQILVGKILRVPQEHVGINFTFTQLGGTEATAMKLVAQCRQKSIYLDAKELLEGRTLSQIAAAASARTGIAHKSGDEDGSYFDLSPMQHLYFATPMGRDSRRRAENPFNYRFNQSHLLRIMKPCQVEDIQAAVEALVGHHPMLRARFATRSGRRCQRIVPQTPGSYRFSHHVVGSDVEIKTVIEASQAAIDIEFGPVFLVNFLLTLDGQQLLYLVAHHLVTDLRSWRIIIHDMDELLKSGTLLSMPLRGCIKAQKAAAQEMLGITPSLSSESRTQAYWGLKGLPNCYEDTVQTSFSLSPELTSILEKECCQVFQTDAADIFLAALSLSFAQTFPDRPVPVIWNQEQGPATSTPDMDVSETVGWLTYLSPIFQQVKRTDDYVDVLRRLKDSRRMSPTRSSMLFIPKFCGPENKDASCLDDLFEVVFSYIGPIQDLVREKGVLEVAAVPDQSLGSSTADIGPAVGRAAIFEVNTVVDEGTTKTKFVYNRHSTHENRILSWVSNLEHLILEAIGKLRYHAHELTLADVPSLDVTYQGLQKLNTNLVRSLNLSSVRQIETVCPATVGQQHILLAQSQHPETNFLHVVCEFTSPNGELVDTSRICAAWQLVTMRHAVLRTVFLDSVTQTGLYDQIILRKTSPEMLFLENVPPDDPLDELNSLPNLRAVDAKLPHRLTVCKTPTKTLLKLDVSAAVCDAESVRAVLQDLLETYSTQKAISRAVGFSYPNYIEFLKATRKGESVAHWKEYLKDAQPCMFPELLSISTPLYVAVTCELDVSASELQTFSRNRRVSVQTALRLAWALVLRSFTATGNVCFAVTASGRDSSVTGSAEAVGPFTNTVPCAITLSPDENLNATLLTVYGQLKAGLEHQYVSIPEVQHALALKGGQRLFNTCLSYHEEDVNITSRSTSQQLKLITQRHTLDFDVSLIVRKRNTGLSVDISTRIMSEEQAVSLANTLRAAIRGILTSENATIANLNLFSDRDYAEIVSWNIDPGDSSDLEKGNTVIHDLAARHAHATPNRQAICAWDGDLTFYQLINHATRLAHRLLDLGVGPQAIVPVVLEKSRWAPVALLAVLKTGAAFVPIDAADLSLLPAILEQIDAPIVITDEKTASLFNSVFDEVVVLNDALFDGLPQHHYDSIPSIATPDDMACIVFNQTSSKAVRGVAFTHRALSITFQAQGPALRIGDKSRVLQLCSLAIDIALSEIFVTLSQGGCLCIPAWTGGVVQNYVATVQKMRVTWSFMTPYLSRKVDPAKMPTLKVVCFRTSSLDEDTYLPWARKANVVLAYGAPEICPLGISFLDVLGPQDLRNIGRPVVGSTWVVDPADSKKLTPVGAVGELVVEGPMLGRRLPFDEGRTENRKLGPEIRGGGLKTRYFRTVHSVRYLDDGIMQFVPTQRGRVELDGSTVDRLELARQSRRCLGQGIDVIVEVVACRGIESHILAVFVECRTVYGPVDLLNPSTAVRKAIGRVKQLVETGLRNRVAPNLIPSIFVPVQQFPLTASLKINRRQLRKIIFGLSHEQLLGLAMTPSSSSIRPPESKPLPLTEHERRLRAIWAQILNIDQESIAASDGLFDIGGDEVLAVKVVVACRHEDLAISVSGILRNASLTEICRSMGRRDSTLTEYYSPQNSATSSARPQSSTPVDLTETIAAKLGINRKEVEEVAETSAMQLRYIEAGMLRGRADIDYFTFSFAGVIDTVRLEEACKVLVSIHSILRTAFTAHNRRVYQAVLRSHAVNFRKKSCPSSASGMAKVANNMISEDRLSPMAFNRPMTAFMLLDGGKQSCLIMRLSKAQYDSASIDFLVKDLKRLYERPDKILRRPSYCDFIKAVRARNSGNDMQYWKTLLEGATMTCVVDHKQPYHLSTIIKTLTQRVQVPPLSNHGISTETILKSAWAMVLGTLSASPDILFGHIVPNRNINLPDNKPKDNIMGPVLNTIPIRVRFPPGGPSSPQSVLQQIQTQATSSLPFQTTDFPDIIQKCTPWPYWTRFSTVVHHQQAETALIPGQPKTFTIGSSSSSHDGKCKCTLDIIPSYARDLPDLLLESVSRSGTDKLDMSLTYDQDRVPSQLAEQAFQLLLANIPLLTTQSTITSTNTYLSLTPQIPISASPPKTLPPTSPLPPPLTSAKIEAAIRTAWSSVLDPIALGVSETEVRYANFYDLWGSLVPAAQLAGRINRELAKCGLGKDVRVCMEEVVDFASVGRQVELVGWKIAGGEEVVKGKGGDGKVGVSLRRKGSVVGFGVDTCLAAGGGLVKGVRRMGSRALRPGKKVEAVDGEASSAPSHVVAVAGSVSTDSTTPSSTLAPGTVTTSHDGKSSRDRSEDEAAEGADVLIPLRSDAAASVEHETQTNHGRHYIVSPLSAVVSSGNGTRLWKGLGGRRGMA